MKRVLLSLIVVFLVASVSYVMGAGQKEGGAEEEQIRLVHFHHSQPPFDEIHTASAEAFMAKYPNVDLKISLFADADMPTKVRTAITAGTEMDTFDMNNLQTAWFLENGVVAEIIPSAFEEQTVQDVVNMWDQGAYKYCGGYYNGKYYGVPSEIGNYVAWINKTHMTEAGLNQKPIYRKRGKTLRMPVKK